MTPIWLSRSLTGTDLGQQSIWFYRRSLFFSTHDSFICQALYLSVYINSNCMKQKIKCIQKITLIYILMTITKEMYDKIFFWKRNLNYPLDKNSECTWSNICFCASISCFHSFCILYGHVLSRSWALSYLVQDRNSRILLTSALSECVLLGFGRVPGFPLPQVSKNCRTCGLLHRESVHF